MYDRNTQETKRSSYYVLILINIFISLSVYVWHHTHEHGGNFVSMLETKLSTRFVSTTKISMKCVVNWIPLCPCWKPSYQSKRPCHEIAWAVQEIDCVILRRCIHTNTRALSDNLSTQVLCAINKKVTKQSDRAIIAVKSFQTRQAI